MRARTVRAAGLLAVVALCAACHKTQARATATGPAAPAGEVWLTAAQVADAKITVAPVTAREIDDTVLTSGTITLDDLRAGHVFSPVTGRVLKIFAQLGQHVKKGEPLAQIESPDLATAVSDVHKAEADLIAAEHDLKRKKALLERGGCSAADVEASEDSYRRAKAELERARLRAEQLGSGQVDAVTGAYVLAAPIDGEVLMRNINPGIEVQGLYSGGASVELYTIGEIDRVWVIGDLYEMDIARVHAGTPASVTVVGHPDKVFSGRVDWVSDSLDPSTRTAKVRCTFDNPDRLLRPMMYATVHVEVDQKTATAIPRSSLLRLGDSKIVFVETGESDGLVRFRRVAVDVDEGEASAWLEVKHGLEPGQKIVTSGAILLSAHM
jgi:cobalt-zinc-cadmium efflux system membrane fusion protein